MHHSEPTLNHTNWYKKAQLHICIHSSIFFSFFKVFFVCFLSFFQKHSKYTKWHQIKKKRKKKKENTQYIVMIVFDRCGVRKSMHGITN